MKRRPLSCLESGTDALCGGAEYNNSSLTYACIGSAVNSLVAVRAAYDGRYSLSELREALRADWKGYNRSDRPDEISGGALSGQLPERNGSRHNAPPISSVRR